MSPIQEETGSDDMEEGEGQDPEYDQTDSCAESLPDGKKRAKKFKKMKTEQVPAGKRSNVSCAWFSVLCGTTLGLNRTAVVFLNVSTFLDFYECHCSKLLCSKSFKPKVASYKNCKNRKTQTQNPTNKQNLT